MLGSIVDEENQRSPIGCPSWRWVHRQIDQTKYPCSL